MILKVRVNYTLHGVSADFKGIHMIFSASQLHFHSFELFKHNNANMQYCIDKLLGQW